MNTRIKAVRNELKLTQDKFAAQMGVKKNNIACYETGKSRPSDSVISLICRTYNVNEVWLRTGEGEMFVQRSREDDIADYVGRIMGGKCSEFENAIISVMAKTSIEEWELIERKAKELLAALEAKEKPGQD